MKYYIIAGEASGDLHASNLIKALAQKDRTARFRGWGGTLMEIAGCRIVRNYKDTAIMGFLTVITHLGTIGHNIKDCCQDIETWNPDVLILVDYGGFNLKIARFAKKKGFKVFFYISPKLWAWNSRRMKNIKRDVDAMFVIFPFEVDYYKEHGYRQVFYGGNPLSDSIYSRPEQNMDFGTFRKKYNLPDKPVISLVAGSRSQELKHILPKMLEMVPRFPEYQFVITGAPGMRAEDYKKYTGNLNIPILFGDTYQIVSQSRAALVTSGTATLETALLHIPQVVCYNGEGGALYYLLFKIFVKVRYISLVNLIMGHETVVELLMQKLNSRNLEKELKRILPDGPDRTKMLEEYAILTERVGKTGASERFAKQMLKLLKTSEDCNQ